MDEKAKTGIKLKKERTHNNGTIAEKESCFAVRYRKVLYTRQMAVSLPRQSFKIHEFLSIHPILNFNLDIVWQTKRIYNVSPIVIYLQNYQLISEGFSYCGSTEDAELPHPL